MLAWVYVGTLSEANSKADKLLYTSNVDSTSDDSDGENRTSLPRKRRKPAKLRKDSDVEQSDGGSDSSPSFKKPIAFRPRGTSQKSAMQAASNIGAPTEESSGVNSTPPNVNVMSTTVPTGTSTECNTNACTSISSTPPRPPTPSNMNMTEAPASLEGLCKMFYGKYCILHTY